MPSRQQSNRRVGHRLRVLLDDRFVTQEELAQALGVHVQNVSRWVRNETSPQKRRVRQIAEFFGVEPGELLDSDDDLESAA